MNIVIYGSEYGTAKRYAEELSNRLGFNHDRANCQSMF